MRISLACALGALWSLMVVFVDAYAVSPVWQIMILLGLVICAAVMTSVASGRRSVSPMLTLSYIAVSVGLGGGMTVLYGFVSRTFSGALYDDVGNTENISAFVFIIAAIAAGGVSLIYGKLREDRLSRKHVELTLFAYQKVATLELMSDSGNLLRDPISHKPVIIISHTKLADILPKPIIECTLMPDKIKDIPTDMVCRVRFVPIKSVMGQGIMLCFCPDRLLIDGRETDALIGIDISGSEYDGCDGIIPQILLNL